jgi:hypothetical protein
MRLKQVQQGCHLCRAESADGTLRTLVLSVEDHVNFLDGRKVKRKQEAPRWIDAYTVPGQFIGVRYPADPITASASASITDGEKRDLGDIIAAAQFM